MTHSALLHAGIAAAHADDKPLAREHLREFLVKEPRHEVAWLWLASVAETSDERLACVERVLAINPQRERANEWHAPMRQACAQEALTRGVATAKAGDTEAARIELLRATELDPCRELAWLWLASVAASPSEKLAHLERVLAINPANAHALSGVQAARASSSQLHEQRAHEPEEVHAPDAQPESVTDAREPATPQAADAVVPTTHHPVATRTVMIVDDSPTVRRLVTIKLERQGHRVIEAADGMEALNRINEEIPDLILSDIAMPRMDGYQLCRLIKTNHATCHVPVVMLSGEDGCFDKTRGELVGSTAYLSKPFEPETLLRVVSEHCASAVVTAD